MKQQQATWEADDWKPRKGPHRLASAGGPTRAQRSALEQMHGAVVLHPVSSDLRFGPMPVGWAGYTHRFILTATDFEAASQAIASGARLAMQVPPVAIIMDPDEWTAVLDEAALSIEFTRIPPPPLPRLTFHAPL